MSPLTATSPNGPDLSALLPLAKELDENKVTPGVLGFIVFALLGLAVWMLMKSMNKHMKRVDFEERPTRADGGGTASAAPAARSAASAPTASSAPSSSAAPSSGDGSAGPSA